MKKYLSLGLWIIVFEAISMAIGTVTEFDVDGWYKTLTPPPLVPPNIVFPIVWTILYALIAAAGWHIWHNRNSLSDGKVLLRLFIVYMVLNWSWSFVFFSAHQLLGGFIWILALNVIAFIIIMKAWQNLRVISWLLIPPLLWTCFAAYLNGGYWWLNAPT